MSHVKHELQMPVADDWLGGLTNIQSRGNAILAAIVYAWFFSWIRV